jgi:hypothetical protein
MDEFQQIEYKRPKKCRQLACFRFEPLRCYGRVHVKYAIFHEKQEGAPELCVLAALR